MADRELIDVSDEVEALSEERQQVALLRAFRRLDVPFEILDDGTINITDEDVDLYSDEILEAYSDEMKKMVASDIFGVSGYSALSRRFIV